MCDGYITEYLLGRLLHGIWYFDVLLIVLLGGSGSFEPGWRCLFSRWCSRRLRVHGGALDRRRPDGHVELGPRFALATSPSSSIGRRLLRWYGVLRLCLLPWPAVSRKHGLTMSDTVVSKASQVRRLCRGCGYSLDPYTTSEWCLRMTALP